jgi:protein-S-isoprenylcysteine O-methyltransferase Ste14
MTSLNVRAFRRLAALAFGMGLLLFLPARTIQYWQAWLYLVVFTGSSLLLTFYLMKKDPALLRRRMSGGPAAEREPRQKLIMLFASIGFLALLVVPALDRRFGWCEVPTYVALVGNILVAIGFYGIFLVYRENTFTSATIELAQDHRVISTGPYAIVRHPMYASGCIFLLGTPFALGSYWGLVPFAATMPFLIWRLVDEERFLAQRLPGYTDYQRLVPYRLIPRVW